MFLKEKLNGIVVEAVMKVCPGTETVVLLDKPANDVFGDFSTNVALTLASHNKKNPKKLAEDIKNAVVDREGIIKEISVAGPGFLNFTLQPQKWIASLSCVNSDFGKKSTYHGKKANVEFISANPTGPLHIGNARGGPLGDAIANLLSAVGYQVTREYYINDVGGQIDRLGESILGRLSENQGIAESGRGGEYSGEYVNELAVKAGEKKIKSLAHDLGLFGIGEIMVEIRKDCEAMGIPFDSWRSEGKIAESGATEKVIGELKRNSAVVEKEGALWFAPKGQEGEDRESVLTRSDGGRPTYFANDIAYHARKYLEGFDLMVNVWGSNHHGHVSRIKAALSVLGYDSEKIKTVLYQYVRVKRGNDIVKMSKRAGNFVTAREVLDEVGRDAFRFYLLLRAPESHLDFDLNLAKSQTAENPVYYVQYAHARICSIFSKAKEQGIPAPSGNPPGLEQLISLPEEIGLARLLLEYPEIVERGALDLSPHRISFYLLDLARSFQSYYDKAREDERYRVLAGAREVVEAKLVLLGCIRQVIRNGLDILGISAPEKM